MVASVEGYSSNVARCSFDCALYFFWAESITCTVRDLVSFALPIEMTFIEVKVASVINISG